MNTLNLLEARAVASRLCNDLLGQGVEALSVALMLDSVKADLLAQVPYNALAQYDAQKKAEEAQKEPKEEITEEGF